MLSFNILGDCVSRDIVQPLISNKEVLVQQFCSFASPISLFSEKPEKMLSVEELPGDMAVFHKRCAALDFNKKVFDYLFAKKSDYLILDILDARHNVLQYNNHCITVSKYMATYANEIPYPIDKYTLTNPFEISESVWETLIEQLCNKILAQYPVSQIILHKHFCASNTLLKSGNIIPCLAPKETINQINTLCEFLFSKCETLLNGCHIINFPENVIANHEHKWGPSALHYHNLYYEYGSKALQIIGEKLPSETEQLKLEELRINYSEKLELVCCKAQLKAYKNKFWGTSEALNFMKKLNIDWIKEEKFKKWLIENKNLKTKISILSSADVAGIILKKALQAFEIEQIFESPKSNPFDLTTEELSMLQESDLIVYANIHTSSIPKFPIVDNLPKIILISDLIK